MTMLPIPVCAEDLTASWFESALREGGSGEVGNVTNVDINPVGVGIGLVGTLFRCTLTYASEDQTGPSNVVVKIRSADPKNIGVAKMFLLYQKEVEFYRDLAPITPIDVPIVHYSDFDPRTHDFVLVLEDLSHMEVRSQLDGGTEEQGLLAIRKAAAMHARFWAKDRQPPLKSYYSLLKPSFTLKIHAAFHKAVEPVIENFGAELSIESKQLIRAFGDTLAGRYREMGSEPLTLTHGDFRLDNMFFGESGSEDLKMVDWQTNGVAIGMTDVAYFLAGSLESDVRRTIEREALAEYHAITCRDGGASWSEEECWRSYRSHMVTAMTVPVIACGELSVSDERAFELLHCGIKRMDAALSDLEVIEFCPQRRSVFSLSGMQSRVGNQLSKLVPDDAT